MSSFDITKAEDDGSSSSRLPAHLSLPPKAPSGVPPTSTRLKRKASWRSGQACLTWSSMPIESQPLPAPASITSNGEGEPRSSQHSISCLASVPAKRGLTSRLVI